MGLKRNGTRTSSAMNVDSVRAGMAIVFEWRPRDECLNPAFALSRIPTKAVSVRRLTNRRLHFGRDEVPDWLNARR
ncbi:hypothetical protein TNCV_2777501 [Trichonephila clavipes]|nr:hypothetical protein TNCV_2777501 [Trichonephila clavipes]